MTKTTIYIPEELRVAIRSTAQREGRSQSEVIRAALAEYVEARPRLRPRSIGSVNDPDFDASRDEEWLDREWGGRLGADR